MNNNAAMALETLKRQTGMDGLKNTPDLQRFEARDTEGCKMVTVQIGRHDIVIHYMELPPSGGPKDITRVSYPLRASDLPSAYKLVENGAVIGAGKEVPCHPVLDAIKNLQQLKPSFVS